MTPKIKFLMIAICLLTATSYTHTQIESGTVVILGVYKKKIVVAADSRESTDEGAYRDEACKITALSDKLIFTAAGDTKNILRNGTALWDASREARTALSVTNRVIGEKPGDFFDRVAHKWGEMLATNISASIRPSDALALKDDQIIVDGLFIGVDEANNLHVAHQTIRAKVLRGTPYVAADGVKTANIPDKIVFAHLGEGDIFDEFEAVKSSRSKQWHQRLPAYATRWAAKDRDLAVAMLAVDLTGLHGMTLPKNSSVHVVGGKTDAVKITPEGGVQWVQRKSQCPEH